MSSTSFFRRAIGRGRCERIRVSNVVDDVIEAQNNIGPRFTIREAVTKIADGMLDVLKLEFVTCVRTACQLALVQKG